MGRKLFDNLDRPLDFSKADKSLWSDKCEYLDPQKCSNFNPENFNFVVMQLNIRSILVCQTELCDLLQLLSDKNSRINVLMLCETYLTSKTVNLENIPGYTIVSNH